jgi:predicted O-linked N-acetylglucosamine transferase (SPINDLY family)
VLDSKGLHTEALQHLFTAVELDEACIEARYVIAVILSRRQEVSGAMEQLSQALQHDPRHVPSLVLLSLFESSLGNGKDAEDLALRALALAPQSAAAHNALGDARAALKNLDGAQESYARAAQLEPNQPDAMISTATILWHVGEHSEATARLEAALEKLPNDPLIHEALAYSHYLRGDPLRAIALARRAIALDPTRLSSRSFLLGLQYIDASLRTERLQWAKEWNDLAKKSHPRMPPPVVDRTPDRPLRVAYCSGGFKNHPVGYAMASLLGRHDAKNFEIFIYANQEESDETTAHVRRSVKEWRAVARMSDPQLAETIRKDKIDILIDLCGHTSTHRLEVFVRRPAPIQVTWNWTATTGLDAMDWVLADDICLPPEEEQWWVERPWRLPDSNIPIPRLRLPTVVSPPPCGQVGVITFGSFNSLYKVTDEVMALWARVVERVKGSRFLLNTPAIMSASVRDTIRERFVKAGLPEEKLVLYPGAPRLDFLRNYNMVDIVLDTFPYNGGISTVEAVFMGVPVVTRLGDSFCSNMGASAMHALGLPELVGKDDDDFVAVAERLAHDREKLSMLRVSLRSRLDRAADPLPFARKLEAAYRGMWLDYLSK